MSENPLDFLMNPKTIATVGAGNNPMKMGTMQATSIVKGGYEGKFYPIHPAEKTVLGHRAYPSVHDLPEAPDLATLVVPPARVIPLLEDFGKIGTRRAIIMSAGFRETGTEGKAHEDRLNEVAERYGIRFLGPNCMGILNSQISLNLTVSPLRVKPGILGFASHSGTYVAQTLTYLKKRGIRFSKAISIGNETNINIIDALEYLGADKDTRAVILYIEGICDGRKLIEVARKITPHKPVLAQYVGGSTAGARAGMSHTGALAGPDILCDGILKQAGIIRCTSIEDLFTHGWALATQPPLRGKRIGIVTNSGGPGTAISHTLDLGGMEVPRFSEDLQNRLRPHMPPHASTANPVDLTFYLDMELLAATVPEIIMKSNEVDGMIIHGVVNFGAKRGVQSGNQDSGILLGRPSDRSGIKRMVSLPSKYNIPLLISSFFDRDDKYTAAYEDNGIPVFDSPEKAARAMVSLLSYREIRDRKTSVPPVIPEPDMGARRIIMTALEKGQKALDEHEAKKILSAYGIPVTLETLVFKEEDAVHASSALGFPVVIKACSWEIMHKTEKGLIVLNVRTEAEVRDSFQAIRKLAEGNIPILVQQMVSGDREFVVGMTRFPRFGPCVLFGLGGVFTEAINDTSFRLAPLHAVEAEEMIFAMRAKKILGRFRGMPPVDCTSLVKLLQNIGIISILHPEIAEIDLNPVIIHGAKPVVADALFVLS
ncbi:MAG: acetate--CoA ligase family protein [Syntrophales bacterium]|nr:acetate--CoA ligase family protein [Syntrophales bacterium]